MCIRDRIEILNIEQDINSKVKSQINQNQREYYLREQMRAIQDELGVTEDVEDEIEGFRTKLEELQLEDKTREKIEKEISRFSKMQPSSAEEMCIRDRNQVAMTMGLTTVTALAYLMFNLYTPPCFAAIGAMNSEMKSAKWLWAAIGLQLGTGYTLSLIHIWKN